jgi:hypothetical protein
MARASSFMNVAPCFKAALQGISCRVVVLPGAPMRVVLLRQIAGLHDLERLAVLGQEEWGLGLFGLHLLGEPC